MQNKNRRRSRRENESDRCLRWMPAEKLARCFIELATAKEERIRSYLCEKQRKKRSNLSSRRRRPSHGGGSFVCNKVRSPHSSPAELSDSDKPMTRHESRYLILRTSCPIVSKTLKLYVKLSSCDDSRSEFKLQKIKEDKKRQSERDKK